MVPGDAQEAVGFDCDVGDSHVCLTTTGERGEFLERSQNETYDPGKSFRTLRSVC